MKLKNLLTISCGLVLVFSSCKKDDNTANNVVKDADGNSYKTVTIGSQTWMVENLKTTKYNDGTPIPNVTNDTEWGDLSTGAYCNYDNDASHATTYGRLYNWYAVNTGKLAPKGWHVPSSSEWNALKSYLIANGYNYDGTTSDNKIAKSLASTTGWNSSTDEGAIGNNHSTNNTSGFTALPGGIRFDDGTFGSFGNYGNLWSSTQNVASLAFSRYLDFDSDYLGDIGSSYKVSGLSVRCLRGCLKIL